MSTNDYILKVLLFFVIKQKKNLKLLVMFSSQTLYIILQSAFVRRYAKVYNVNNNTNVK